MKSWVEGEEGKRAKGEGGVRGSEKRLSSSLSPFPPFPLSPEKFSRGFSLIELVVTLTVLSILTLGVVPLVKTSVKRAREQQLRDTLRGMREAVKEFRRDAVGVQCGTGGVPPTTIPPQPGTAGGTPPIDPRSKVMISDCTIFKVENPDHYPPTLETLVEGVNIIPRGVPLAGSTEGNATDNKLLSTRKKVYLRAIPVDPTTGKAEWDLRSSYDEAGASDWGGENVFDVRSKSIGTALNGEKYADW